MSKQQSPSEYVEQLINPTLSRQDRYRIYKEIHDTLNVQLIMAVCYENEQFAEYTKRFACTIREPTPHNVDLYMLLRNEFFSHDIDLGIDINNIDSALIKTLKQHVINGKLLTYSLNEIYTILASKRQLNLLRELIHADIYSDHRIDTYHKRLVYSATIELDDVDYLTEIITLMTGTTTIVEELSKYRDLNIKGQNILKHILEHKDSELYPAFKLSCAIASDNVHNIMICPMYKTDYSMIEYNYRHETYNVECIEYMAKNNIRVDYNNILGSVTYDNLNANSLVECIYKNIKVKDVVLSDDLIDMVDDDTIKLIYYIRDTLDLEMPRNDILHRRCKALNIDAIRLFDDVDINDLDMDIFDYLEYTKFLDTNGADLLNMISHMCITSLDVLAYMLPKLNTKAYELTCTKLLTEYIQSSYIPLIKCMLDAGIKLTNHHISLIKRSTCVYLKKWIALKYPDQLMQ